MSSSSESLRVKKCDLKLRIASARSPAQARHKAAQMRARIETRQRQKSRAINKQRRQNVRDYKREKCDGKSRVAADF